MRILLITDMLPYPPISGTELRTYNLLRHLSQNHDVWLISLVGDQEEAAEAAHLADFCQRVETILHPSLGALERPADFFRYMLAGKPPDLRLLYSEEMIERIQAFITEVDFDIIQIQNSYMGLYLEAIPQELHDRVVLEFIDIVHSKYDRIYRLEPKTSRKVRLWLHSKTMKHWEPFVASEFVYNIMMSKEDEALLLADNPSARTAVVPNGVDAQAYRPLPFNNPTPSLIYVGNMDYQPNVDAVLFFCEEVLPLIRDQVPDVELWIVGLNPRQVVRELDGDGIHVTGRVDDVRDYYGQSTVCVVPLRAGGGTRLKIVEAMALGRPVVSTSIGCEGLTVTDEEDILIADEPEAFAEKTIRLLNDESLRQTITKNARQLVLETYDWDVITAKLLEVYTDITG